MKNKAILFDGYLTGLKISNDEYIAEGEKMGELGTFFILKEVNMILSWESSCKVTNQVNIRVVRLGG